jgi:hypothetical protein
LNGSKFLVLLSFLLFFTGCGIFQAGRDKGKDKDLGEKEVITTKVDTLTLEKIPASEFPPIKKDEIAEDKSKSHDSFKKEEYKIGMLIPFNALESAFDVSGDNTDLKFVNYYAGVKLALKELETLDSRLSVSVFDSERSKDVVQRLLSNEAFQEADVIIGPYDRNGLQATASFGKENNKTIISPWLASTRITDENPFYVQLRPSLSAHYFKIIEHVNANFNDSEIVLVGRDKASDKNRFKYFQKSYAALGNKYNDAIQEYIVSEDSLSYGETAFDSLFIDGGKKALILPNWNYNDEDFIYACLRRLNVEKVNTELYVYGMPIIFDSEKMDFDFYRNLNIRICLSEFVDWESEKVKIFMRKYYDTFGDLPTSDAFEGYDMMKFIGTNLIKYGINFHLFLEEDQNRYLQTAFDIQGVFDDLDEKFENMNYLENKHLDLIQYTDNQFSKIDR